MRLFQRITRGRREVTRWKLDVRRHWWPQPSQHSGADRWLFHRISWWGVNTQLWGCFYRITKRIRQELTLSRKRQQGKQQVPPSRGDTTAEAEKVMVVPCPFLLPLASGKRLCLQALYLLDLAGNSFQASSLYSISNVLLLLGHHVKNLGKSSKNTNMPHETKLCLLKAFPPRDSAWIKNPQTFPLPLFWKTVKVF